MQGMTRLPKNMVEFFSMEDGVPNVLEWFHFYSKVANGLQRLFWPPLFSLSKNEWKVLNGLHFVRNDFRGFAHSKNFQVGSGSFIGFPIALAGLKRYQDASATAKMLKRPQPAPKGSRWPRLAPKENTLNGLSQFHAISSGKLGLEWRHELPARVFWDVLLSLNRSARFCIFEKYLNGKRWAHIVSQWPSGFQKLRKVSNGANGAQKLPENPGISQIFLAGSKGSNNLVVQLAPNASRGFRKAWEGFKCSLSSLLVFNEFKT